MYVTLTNARSAVVGEVRGDVMSSFVLPVLLLGETAPFGDASFGGDSLLLLAWSLLINKPPRGTSLAII